MKFQHYIQKHNKGITFISGALIILGFLSKVALNSVLFYNLFFIIASILGAVPIFIHAYQALRVKTISIELLVSIAVLGAFIIGEYNESAIVTFLFLFGSYLEQRTLEKTRRSIKTLTEMAPQTALVIQADHSIEEIEIDDVDTGDQILVKTGAQIPVDGKITDGEGYVNEASVTGESRPVTKSIGDSVFSGTILDNGTLTITATRVGDDTTFAKIIELVEEAQDSKSHAEKFIDRFSTFYTPAVLLIALIIGLISQDFRLAITILVLGCPGALVIGAPVSNVAGIGNGAKNGVLLKGGEVMDSFSKVDTLIFDKTGTLTKGSTELSALKTYVPNASEILGFVARVEKDSDHPLGRAIYTYADQQKITYQDLVVQKTSVLKGQGIHAEIADTSLLIGNESLMQSQNITLSSAQQADLHAIQASGSSSVIVASNQHIALIIGVSDVIREGVKASLAQLKTMGIKKLIMLTGDNQATAEAVAQTLGIDEVHANLLPEQKVDYVKQFKEEGRHVAFIGDGVNDSPSIALADIGIAMGSGTDVAVETSDIVLMQSSFAELVHAYGLTKKTILNMKENIIIAIATVVFLLIGLIFGYIYMASGMFIHEASILVVIFNAMRLIRYSTK